MLVAVLVFGAILWIGALRRRPPGGRTPPIPAQVATWPITPDQPWWTGTVRAWRGRVPLGPGVLTCHAAGWTWQGATTSGYVAWPDVWAVTVEPRGRLVRCHVAGLPPIRFAVPDPWRWVVTAQTCRSLLHQEEE